ncbi:hypothetical protein E2C01_088382 [Portunus trituberculatus]|uniref:Uncharacterized protein n=1 Tax=Portunus trituberculatus TaxID=210409 RepID=A0A5B7JJP9_PORTR|nr:hypothetical protein [Portunus trituberculatus]
MTLLRCLWHGPGELLVMSLVLIVVALVGVTSAFPNPLPEAFPDPEAEADPDPFFFKRFYRPYYRPRYYFY